MTDKYNFEDYQNDTLTKPRDLAWENWMKFEKVGDKVQGFIRDVFYRPEEGQFSEQRCLVLEQPDGKLIIVTIKRRSFILNKTDDLRLGDPLTVELLEERASSQKGYNPTKIYGYFGVNLPDNAGEKTVKELEYADMNDDVAQQKMAERAAEDQGKEEGDDAEIEGWAEDQE